MKVQQQIRTDEGTVEGDDYTKRKSYLQNDLDQTSESSSVVRSEFNPNLMGTIPTQRNNRAFRTFHSPDRAKNIFGIRKGTFQEH